MGTIQEDCWTTDAAQQLAFLLFVPLIISIFINNTVTLDFFVLSLWNTEEGK